jgi:hypothetical protein
MPLLAVFAAGAVSYAHRVIQVRSSIAWQEEKVVISPVCKGRSLDDVVSLKRRMPHTLNHLKAATILREEYHERMV